MQTCSTCKYWVHEGNAPGWRECSRTTTTENLPHDKETLAMAGTDCGGDNYGVLETSPDFGCVMHTPNE